MARRDRMAACPIVVATAGVMAGDVEQVLARECRAGEGAIRRTRDGEARTGDECVDRVCHLRPCAAYATPITRHTFCPPKENEFGIACVACASRATLGRQS